MDKTYARHVVVTTNEPEFGDQRHALVFRDPEEAAAASYAFPVGHLVIYDDLGASRFIANDKGVIPYRERTQGDDEDLGLTWQLPK